ncbi:GntR family transcriptional regulator [Gulosibacter molinativorax]|uniref:GntR family transcriptional regulator n=1 Tax=Gulosibacter molinativorax TaxID=256821 RepID=A0ABT7CA17_9MICO|nr:GntR family transcriptional regulator [Gulosibacter molinativorax]MDJ1372035.1 GntR family transcriptional regulator [Gulosibacter molinativorax]QUY63917.1 Bacterial regulatory s, gntR family protein [Gulosibacter molinativorax]
MRASDKAYATLRDEILSGELAPGTPMAEVEQSTRLGVSRTPVREAFSRLTGEGLLTSKSARLLVVTELTAERIRALYELRDALETRAAALAAQRRERRVFEGLREQLEAAPALLEAADGEAGIVRYFEIVDALDLAIEDAVGNSYVTGALTSARLHSALVRRLSQHDPARLRAAAREHLLVVDAILAGEAELAAAAVKVHLHNSLESALARL